jgi:hypothetical protein
MSEWIEYHPGLEWPVGGHVSWQYLSPSGWHNTYNAMDHWSTGTRVRFCIPEVKTKGDLELEAWNIVAHKQYFSARRTFCDGFYAGWQASREHPEVE